MRCCAGGILNNLSPEQLQSFDAVTVRPRAVQPALGIATAAAEGSGISGGSNSSHTPATALGSALVGAATEATLPVAASGSSGSSISSSSSGGDSLGPALVSGVELGRSDQADGATSEGAASAAATGAGGGVGKEEGGMTVTVSMVHTRWGRPPPCFTAAAGCY